MATRPLVVHVTDLLRRPGTRRELSRDVVFDGLALSTSEVPAGAPVAVTVTVEAQGEQVMVHGTVAAPWEGPCRRCLEPASGELSTTVDEVFERHPVDGETWPLTGDHLDLEPVVREAVLLALPLAPLCSPDCQGPDPERFPASVEGEAVGDGPEPPVEAGGDQGDAAEPQERPRDPRWAALDALKFD